MSTQRLCPRCGARFAAAGPADSCPNCLLALALAPTPVVDSPAAPTAVPSAPSALHYFGDYQLLSEIARGGMGIVWKGRQVSLNRLVAVKLLQFGQFASEEFRRRFRAEAEAAASLQHPNIVAIHEVGEHQGQPYFSMDYVDGPNLAELVRDQPLPAKRAATLLKTIAEAVHYAHLRGVIHRDLKPSNVILDVDGQPRVTDFGLAKRLANSESAAPKWELTVTGQVLGTPGFMSPEQAGGRRGEVAAAGDIYSLGAVLYFLLTGRAPFTADSLEETLRQVHEVEPVSPRLLNPAVPRDLETICLKCLGKEPRRRYDTARCLAEDLGRFLAGEAIHARPIAAIERLWRWCRRKPALAGSLGSIFLLLLAVAIGSTVAAIRINEARGRAASAEVRAQQAQGETVEKLWDSYLAQARANRRSGQPGQRFATLDVIAKAAAMKSAPELCEEAVAALSLVDARLIYQRTNADAQPIIVAFDPDRRRYAVALSNGEISIRNAGDSSEQFRLPATGARVGVIQCFSDDGKQLSALYRDRMVRVWDLAERRLRIEAPSTLIEVAFSAVLTPDGRFLAVSDGSNDVRWLEVSNGLELRRLPTSAPANMVQVTPKGDRLAAGRFGQERVEIFDLPSGHRLTPIAHPPYVRKFAWDHEGRWLATIGGDREIRIWDVEAGKEQCRLVGHNENIEDVTFAARERLAVSTGWDGSILWNYETGERLLTLPGHAARVTLSSDGRWLFRQSFEQFTYQLWEMAMGTPVRTYGSNQRRQLSAGLVAARASAFSPDGRVLADAGAGWLRAYDSRDGRELGSTRIGPTAGLAFDHNFNLWASGTRGLLFIPALVDSRSNVLAFGPQESIGPVEEMVRLRLSADGSTVAVAAADDRCRVFDVRTRHERFATPKGSGTTFLALTSDGGLLASSRWGAHHVDIWSLTNQSLLKRLRADSDLLFSGDLAFSPDGRTLLTVGGSAAILWRVGTWERVWTQRRGDLPFAAFSPDGAYVVHRDRKYFLDLLAADTGRFVGRIEMPHMNPPERRGAAFSPDGNYLAVAPMNTHELHVWHLADMRRQLASLGLDWDLPPLPNSKPTNESPLSVRFDGDPR